MRIPVLLAVAAAAPVPLLVVLDLADARALWFVPPVAFLGWLIGTRLEMPLDELANTAHRLREGELRARPSMPLRGPWRGVADTMVHLAHQLDVVSRDMEEQVRQRTEELDRKAGQLRALGQIGRQVASVLEPGPLLHYVVRLVRGTFGYDLVAVVQDHGTHLIVSACAMRGVADAPVGRVFAVDDPEVAALARAIRGSDAPDPGDAHDPRVPPTDASDRASDQVSDRRLTSLTKRLEPQSELLVPLRLGDRVLGAMLVQSVRPEAFDDDDVFTVDTIAGQVAVALENARLFETERRLRGMAVTEERQRISREIHDTLAQGFMGILIHLRAMRGAKDPETSEMHRREAETLAQQSLDEARRSVWNLRPARLHERGLADALRDELHRVRRQSDMETNLQVLGDKRAADRLPMEHAAALLRIGQEALHNVVKHAGAQSVAVTLAFHPDETVLEVADDGIGFSLSAVDEAAVDTGGMGLISMRERARHVGGSLSVETAPGRGTRVRVTVPLRTELRGTASGVDITRAVDMTSGVDVAPGKDDES